MIEYYLTESEENMFQKKDVSLSKGDTVIQLNPEQRFQKMDGFGASFTDSSAYLIDKILDEKQKKEVMEKLFDSKKGIGLSLLRNPMGASDYARSIYSYNDIGEGEEDLGLEHFSIDVDKESIIPLTQWAKKINPELKIFASPWSPPAWMKDSGKMVTGQLLKKYYSVYAQYFCRFIKDYKKEGIEIYAVTTQNEPLFVPETYPGMYFPATAALDFVKNHLKPAFIKEAIKTKIFGYDHNWDRIDYPLELLDNAEESFDGIAWHWYGGRAISQTRVYDSYPNSEVHFTEGSGGEWIPAFQPAFSNLICTGIDILRNHSKSFILWNIALDENNGPTVPGFGTSTCRGLVEVSQKDREYELTLDYFGLGHFSKWVRPNAVRIQSTESDSVKSVAFQNEDESYVVVLFNDSDIEKSILININETEIVSIDLPKKSAGTCIFNY